MSDLTSNETMQISSLTGAIEALKVVETYIQKLKKEIEAELKKKLEEIANDDQERQD